MSSSALFASNACHKFGSVATANTALDGTGSNMATLFPGVKCLAKRLVGRHLGSNIATVCRVFLNKNSGTHSSASDNSLIDEVTCAANTVSQVAASIPIIVALGADGAGMLLQATDAILISTGTTIAAGIQWTLEAEDLT